MDATFDVLGVKVAKTNLADASQKIEDWINSQSRTYICCAPVATIIDCQKDDKYLDIVNNAGMTTPDGMPIVWLGKMDGSKKVQRTYGPDLLNEFCSISERRGYKHFFYGGDEQSNAKLLKQLAIKFPELNIVGSIVPPILDVNDLASDEAINVINTSGADILWVGLGSPKQDYWMFNHRDRLNVPVLVGVGAAFDFLSGTKKQAPKWMQQCGLEWFFRLCCEPRRLWRRYILGNFYFLYLIIKSKLIIKRAKI